MATSIIMTSTDQGGNKIQKSLTSVNPKAAANDIRQFANALNGLTTNNYVGTNRIDKFDLSGNKAPVSISVGSLDSSYQYRTITITGGTDAIPYIKDSGNPHFARIMRHKDTGAYVVAMSKMTDTAYTNVFGGQYYDPNSPSSTPSNPLIGSIRDITIAVDETETHQGAQVTFQFP